MSFLPILMYDSDIGVGFGAKAAITRHKRYYDWVAFGSTKGEQWYAFSFSTYAPEARQRKIYSLAFDSRVEYDKLLKSGFFGIGNQTTDNEFSFPRESFKVQATLSRAFSGSISTGLSARFLHYSAYGFSPEWSLIDSLTPGAGESELLAIGVFLARDTRDSDINPGKGTRSRLVLEQSVKAAGLDWNFRLARLELSAFRALVGKKDILAGRLWLQEVWGNAPYQELSKIGDGWTARGYKAGRFLDRAMALTSAEYRFPIYKKLGGVTFVDCGRVWHSLAEISLKDYHLDWGGGLRLYLTDFVARLDIGHSIEGTRIFFNFGQVF